MKIRSYNLEFIPTDTDRHDSDFVLYVKMM